MKVTVDKDTCIGCGLCPSLCEEVFEICDEGYSVVLVDEVMPEFEDAVKDAESSCPVSAITVE